MTLKELRVWHWQQYQRMTCTADSIRADMQRQNGFLAFLSRDDRPRLDGLSYMAARHLEAVQCLDPLLPGSTAEEDYQSAKLSRLQKDIPS